MITQCECSNHLDYVQIQPRFNGLTIHQYSILFVFSCYDTLLTDKIIANFYYFLFHFTFYTFESNYSDKLILKMKGYDTSRVVGMSPNELSEFSCGICLGIFNEPVVTQCCRQTYCKECIDEWLTSNNTCPNDRKSLRKNDLLPVPRFVINLLMNIKIKCEHKENGCEAVVNISELENHTHTCEFGKCTTCGLKKLNTNVHDCVTELIITNKRISDELRSLSNGMVNFIK